MALGWQGPRIRPLELCGEAESLQLLQQADGERVGAGLRGLGPGAGAEGVKGVLRGWAGEVRPGGSAQPQTVHILQEELGRPRHKEVVDRNQC